MLKKTKSFLQLSKLSKAILLEEANPAHLIYISVVSIALLLTILIIWAALITVEESAVSYGQIIPKGPKHIIQHLEGGVVNKVLINDGNRVTKGQLLLVIDGSAPHSELKQLQSREISLLLDQKRLQAFLENKKLNLQDWKARIINTQHNSYNNTEQLDQLVKEEYELLQQQYKKRDDQKSVITAQIKSLQHELVQLQKDLKILNENLDLYQKEHDMYQQLEGKHIISKRDFLILKRRINNAYGEQSQLETKVKKTKQALSEAKNRLSELDSTLREQASQELDDIHTQLPEVRHAITKQIDRVNRLEVKAPTAGIVKGLKVTAGSVVKPGGELLEIVPTDRQLIVESKINTRDIGHIKVGDPVKIKILTYDFARYGGLEGKLQDISASTFVDSDNQPYYKAIITFKQNQNKNKLIKHLLPGMTVQADIITGKKSLLAYLLIPVKVSIQSAFHER